METEIMLATGETWWANTLAVACPDCGGSIVWAEAGTSPGWRRCETCGSEWRVTQTGDKLVRQPPPDPGWIADKIREVS